MIECPNCKHENYEGVLFCTECGSPTFGSDNLSSQSIFTDQSREDAINEVDKPSPKHSEYINTWASLHLIASGHVLPLAERSEFTLGRISDAQPIMPDIDLTSYQAYTCGVSRLHAVLKREGERIFIMDLGSSNGTYLNGKRMQPNVDQQLNHGDIISLGKLRIQILINQP